MAKGKETMDQSVTELRARYSELSKELFDMKNDLQMTKKIEKPHLIRSKKRERARVLTALRQKGETLRQ